MKKEVVIIGGVAAGMSCAAKLFRESDDVNITVYEKGEYISYGACGLPYYIGDVIKDHNKLIIKSPDDYKEDGLIIKVFHEVVSVDTKNQKVEVLDIKEDRKFNKKYDHLVIATGGQPNIPDFFKPHMNNVFTLRDINDGIIIKEKAMDESVEDVVIIGGGYIGLELAESFYHLKKKVRIINRSDKIMKTFDDEIRQVLVQELNEKGIDLSLNHQVEEIILDESNRVKKIKTKDEDFKAELVVVAIGISPNTEFLKETGIEVLKNGAIITDEKMRTNIPNVYAAGDCSTINHRVLGKDVSIALATYANRQGRLLGEILSGKDVSFPGGIGASVVKILDVTLAQAGINETQAKEEGFNYKTSFIKGYSNAGYYPGSKPLYIKFIFDKETQVILGAQMIGEKGSEHRINTLSLAIAKKMTLSELAYMDFAYTPVYSGSWDPIQVACNVAISESEK